MVAMLAVAPSAMAGKSFNGFIGEQFGELGGQFTSPVDVAVNQGGTGGAALGDLYITERGNHRVTVLDADGNFKRVFGRDVVRVGAPGDLGSDVLEVCEVAADCKAGSTGTADDGPGGELANPTGVAINQATGEVFVREVGENSTVTNRRVSVFTASGEFVRAFGWDVVQTGGTGDDNVGAANEFEICIVASECKSGTSGSGAGQFAQTSNSGSGLAVGPGGDVFAVDWANRRVNQYDSAGAFVRSWGYGVDTGANTEFQVCTTASSCQAGVNPSVANANGSFASNSPTAVMVDSQNVVYALDLAPISGTAQNRIVRFDADGAPAAGNAGANLLTPINPTTAGGPLLAATGPGGARGGLEIDPDSDGAGPDEESLLAVRDPSSGDTVVQELDIPTAAGELPADPVTVADTHTYAPQQALGIGMSTVTDSIYLTNSASGWFPVHASGSSPQGVVVLAEAVGPVTGQMDPPTSVGTETATLAGSLDPAGSTVRVQFEVSDTGTDSGWVPVGASQYASGSGDRQVTETATGLLPNTTYRVRLRATRYNSLTAAPHEVVTPEAIFLTDAAPPTVATLGSAQRTDTSAQLRATVDPNGSATEYRFEYGPAGGSFDTRIPVPDAPAGSGNSPLLLTQQLDGLVPGTEYHYRVVAANPAGTATGAAVTFTTDSAGSGSPPVGPRAYELVSPADKISGNGVGLWGGGAGGAGALSGYPAHVGERYAASTDLGSVLVESATSYATDWAFASRTVGGWRSHSPITHAASNRQNFRYLLMSEANEDLSKMVWTSNNALLRPFPELASWPDLFAELVGDWDGRWEMVAPTALKPADQMYNSDVSRLSRSVISADGSHVAFSTGMPTAAGSRAVPSGLAGDGDPSHPHWPDLVAGRAAYVDDLSAGLSDQFDGNGIYANAGTCADATAIPSVAAGLVTGGVCSTPGDSQIVRVTASAGSFTLTVDGQETGPIALNAPPSGAGSVQTALAALPNVGVGNVVVGGVADVAGDDRYFVRFAPALGDVPNLTVDDALLTGDDVAATVDAVAVTPLISSRGAALHSDLFGGSTDKNVVSRDGSRVFFLSPDPMASGLPAVGCTGSGAGTVCPPQLYVRQRNADGSVTTRWLSRAAQGVFENQEPSLTGLVRFAGASEDGDKVFFQTTSPLTSDDPNGTAAAPPPGGVTSGAASSSSWDLYMYDLPDGPDGDPSTADADPAGGALTRISGGPSGGGDCNVVTNAGQGALRFAAADGSRAYFTCAAPLPGVPLAGNGTITEPGGSASTTSDRNLYAYDGTVPGGAWKFVARLPTGGTADPAGPCATTYSADMRTLLRTANRDQWLRFSSGHCVRGTDDGEFMTFWTTGRLTPDDPNSTTVDGYAYDMVEDELVRITAPQGGVGGSYLCNPYHLVAPSLEPVAVQCYGDNGFGEEALELLGVASDPASDGDRVAFFQTRSQLIPEDVDDAYDVYQWRNGDLSLISTGNSTLSGAPGELGGAFYKGNSADGRNVYLATNDRLSWQDVDGVLDIYTARVDGGIPQPPVPVVCGVLAGGCHGGGAATVPAPAVTTEPPAGGGNAAPGARATLAVGGVGAKARRRAARSGVLRLRVRTTAPGRIAVVVRGRAGKRTRVLGRARKQVVRAGTTRIAVRLNRAARRVLARRGLRLAVRVAQPGARPRSITVRLARGARS